jgi:hypothetical protein
MTPGQQLSVSKKCRKDLSLSGCAASVNGTMELIQQSWTTFHTKVCRGFVRRHKSKNMSKKNQSIETKIKNNPLRKKAYQEYRAAKEEAKKAERVSSRLLTVMQKKEDAAADARSDYEEAIANTSDAGEEEQFKLGVLSGIEQVLRHKFQNESK